MFYSGYLRLRTRADNMLDSSRTEFLDYIQTGYKMLLSCFSHFLSLCVIIATKSNAFLITFIRFTLNVYLCRNVSEAIRNQSLGDRGTRGQKGNGERVARYRTLR